MKQPTNIEKGKECLNCGQPLQGENYCPRCGQLNDVSRPTTGEMIRESLSNYVAFDGRFVHTMKNLFRYPGKVARDYSEGKRMQYMHPVRIYFLASLLLLFIFQLDDRGKDIVQVQRDEPQARQDSIRTQLNQLLVEKEVDSLTSAGVSKAKEATHVKDVSYAKAKRMYVFAASHKGVSASAALDSLRLKHSIWNSFLYEQVVKVENLDNEEFGKFFFSKLFWVLFLFLPILALLLKMLYFRSSIYYPEHLYFAFYSQAAFFLLMSVAFLLNFAFDTEAIPFLFLPVFAFYLYKSMKRFYGHRSRRTFGKFVILNIITVPVFGIFFVASALVVFILF